MRRSLALMCAIAALIGGCGDPDPVASASTTGPTATFAPAQSSSTTSEAIDVTSTTLPVSTTISSSTTVPPTTATTSLLPIDQVESGLFCRDLNARGYTFAEAVAYWECEGTPLRMDADRNGIPCQTVYAEAEILAHYGGALPSPITFDASEWVGRVVEVEQLGDHPLFGWVTSGGERFDLRTEGGSFAVPLDAYPEASGWLVASEPFDFWDPSQPVDAMVWVVDSQDDRGTILAVLGLRLGPDRPGDYCWQAQGDEVGGRLVISAGPSHAWVVEESPTYFQRVDRNSIECSAG